MGWCSLSGGREKGKRIKMWQGGKKINNDNWIRKENGTSFRKKEGGGPSGGKKRKGDGIACLILGIVAAKENRGLRCFFSRGKRGGKEMRRGEKDRRSLLCDRLRGRGERT